MKKVQIVHKYSPLIGLNVKIISIICMFGSLFITVYGVRFGYLVVVNFSAYLNRRKKEKEAKKKTERVKLTSSDIE